MIRNCRILEVPGDTIYATWQGYNIFHIERMLNLLAQGYEEELIDRIRIHQLNIGRGIYHLMIRVLNGEEVDWTY